MWNCPLHNPDPSVVACRLQMAIQKWRYLYEPYGNGKLGKPEGYARMDICVMNFLICEIFYLPVCPSSLQISLPETALNILTLSSSEPVTIIS